MKLAITGRHMEITDVLRAQISEKLEHLEKYKMDFISGQVIASIERGRHCLDITLRSADGFTFSAEAVSSDMYSSIDLAIEKIEKQIRKYKDKTRSHSARIKKDYQRTASRRVLEMLDVTPTGAVDDEDDDVAAEKENIIFEEKLELIPMTLQDAILQMETIDRNFWLFLNEDCRLNVVYKRKDGQYGLIEPEL